MKLLADLATKVYGERKKAGKKVISSDSVPGLHKKIQSNRFALANKLIINKLKG
tara:strand:- start:24 stop:185 length:162 start_codon:yes stop_codon:yes gene_type:complete